MASKSEPKDIVLRSQTVSRLEKLPEPIISYAQNFEDVMLWRALGHIENGFYIDIGAQHPTVDSVSKAFYDAGWKGVHIDPNPHYAEMLREERIGDTVLEVAIGRKAGTLDFYAINDTGLSTGDPDIAEMHRKAGRKVVECSVPMTTLKQVLADVEQPDIHWLKIDVEGMEGEVLAGWGTSKIRPWVVVIETVVIGNNTSPIEKWNSVILKKGYTLAYDDGLNLYYVSNKKLELLKPFSYGPNVFDEFKMSGEASNDYCSILNSKIKNIYLEKEILLYSLEEIYESFSWKITRPFRIFYKLLIKIIKIIKKLIILIIFDRKPLIDIIKKKYNSIYNKDLFFNFNFKLYKEKKDQEKKIEQIIDEIDSYINFKIKG